MCEKIAQIASSLRRQRAVDRFVTTVADSEKPELPWNERLHRLEGAARVLAVVTLVELDADVPYFQNVAQKWHCPSRGRP